MIIYVVGTQLAVKGCASVGKKKERGGQKPMARGLGQAARDQKGKRPACRRLAPRRSERTAGEVGILLQDRKSARGGRRRVVIRDAKKMEQPVPVFPP